MVSFEDVDSGEGRRVKQVRLASSEPSSPLVERLVPEKWFSIVCHAFVYRNYGYQDLQTYINFEWSERIDDPWTDLVCAHTASEHHHDAEHCATGTHEHGKHHYQIPYVLDRAFKSSQMKIFDFAVGRKAMRWARSQGDFLNTLIEAAIQAIEETYQESIDRQSVQLVRDTDYTPPPTSATHLQPDPSPTPTQSLLPLLRSKLNSFSDFRLVEMASTGLTDVQRDLLRGAPITFKASPFSFVSTESVPYLLDSLKLTIPGLHFEQNDRFITIKIACPSPDLRVSWNIPPTNPDEAPDALEAFFITPASQEYAFSITLCDRILHHESYATISDDCFIIVLKKKTTIIWPRFLSSVPSQS